MKKKSAAQKIIYRDPKTLKPDPRNARKHSAAQIEQLRASYREFGWTRPILLRPSGMIGAGHGAHEMALAEGVEHVPTITLDLTEKQWRAYAIIDNKLGLNSEWDADLLKTELGALQDIGFDLTITGFSELELGQIGIEGYALEERLAKADETPEPPKKPVVKRGELWILGDHRILCGDSTNAGDVARLLKGSVPDIANCDPPYGISVVKRSSVGGSKPFAGSRGRVHGPARNAIIHPGVYEPVIGDDSTKTAIDSYQVMQKIGVPVIVLWGGNYFANELPASRCWLVWDKENTGSFADAELAWTNQDKIVRLLRHQWSGLIKASERGERRVHPTQKPVALARWVIETLAPKAKTALDLFLGSGSTLIACEMKGIVCFGCEMSPAYIEVIIQRFEAFSGKTAIREDGKTLADLKNRVSGGRRNK